MEIGGQMNLAEVAQALIAVFGFIFVWYQIKQIARTIRYGTQASLYTHYVEVGNCFLQKPHLRPYFYENQVFQPDGENAYLRDEIDLMN